MLRIFSPEKSDGFGQDRTRDIWVPEASMLTTRPPTPQPPLPYKKKKNYLNKMPSSIPIYTSLVYLINFPISSQYFPSLLIAAFRVSSNLRFSRVVAVHCPLSSATCCCQLRTRTKPQPRLRHILCLSHRVIPLPCTHRTNRRVPEMESSNSAAPGSSEEHAA